MKRAASVRRRVGVLGLAALVAPWVTTTGAAAQPAGAAWLPVSTVVPAPAYGAPSGVEFAAASSGADESVALWGDNADLHASVREPAQQSFPASDLVASDGGFQSNVSCTQPDITAAPNGDVLAVWSTPFSAQTHLIEVATRSVVSRTWTTEVVAQQIACDLNIAVGSDGTAAVAWNDGTSVFVSIRPAGTSVWSAPRTVEMWQAQPGDSSPLVKDTRVAVTGQGGVTVVWGAESGTMAGGVNAWRVRAASWDAATTSWSSAVWLQPAGQNEASLEAAAGGSGGPAVSWMATDNASPFTADAAVWGSSGWSAPVVLGTSASGDIALAAAASGGFTATWLAYAPASAVQAATYTPSAGWVGATVATPTTLNPAQTHVVNAAGTPTVLWSGCDGNNSCPVSVSELHGGTWSASSAVSGVNAYYGFAVSASPDGLLTLVSEALDGSIQATATALPPVANTAGPTITGPAYVGSQLTAQPGSWSPAPSSVSYQWYRDGSAVPGATTSTYTPSQADVGHRITMVVTAHLGGYSDTPATSAAVTPTLPPITNTVAPSIAGASFVGDQVTARPGTWSPVPSSFTYQWFRNGSALYGQTAATYTVTQADPGRSLSVLVTAHQPGYQDTSASSPAITPSFDSFAPYVSPHGFRSRFLTAATVTFSWTASDVGSGIASSRVRWRRAGYSTGFASWQYPTAWQALHTTSVTLTGLAPGFDYCFSAETFDKAGNASSWSDPLCVARVLDDRAVSSRPTPWTLGTGRSFYLGTATTARRSGLWIARSGAILDRVGILATRCPTCGAVAVYVGSTLIGKINLTASTTAHQVLFQLPRFSLRRGTVALKTLNARTVQLDGIALSRT